MKNIRRSLLALGPLALGASLAFLVFIEPAAAQQQAQAPVQQQQQTAAPTPPPRQSVTEEMLLRENSRIVGRVTIPDERLAFLEQPQGRTWRQFHEVWGPWIVGLAIVLTLLALVLAYAIAGRQRYEREGPDVRVVRYSGFERFNHWMTAVSFIVLALTGVNYVFGKRLLMPLIGPAGFGDFSQISKYAHNFFAWPFVIGVLVMLFIWARDNLPRRVDREWVRAGGGVFARGRHISAGRFNAGQKLLFWFVVLLTILMFGSGLMLLFPLTWIDVNGMQIAGGVHTIAGALFIAIILAHIYIGTLGTEGAFNGMGSGEVDLAWARHHHDLWAREARRADAHEPREPAAPARPAPSQGA